MAMIVSNDGKYEWDSEEGGEEMSYEALREKAHGLVDTMDVARLEQFVAHYAGGASVKKPLSAKNIDEMLLCASPGDFGESLASIQHFRELTKNDVW